MGSSVDSYKEAILRAPRIFPPDGSSGLYVGDVGIFYKPIERTDALAFSSLSGGVRLEQLVSFETILQLYPLFNSDAKTGVVRSIEAARQVAREVADQYDAEEGQKVVKRHSDYLKTYQEMFCKMLTDEEVRTLSQG